MTEADAAASSLPALVLLSCWWALLSTLDIFFGPNWPGDAAPHASRPRRKETPPAEPDPRFAEICRLDPRFGVTAFLAGAQKAYEIVLQAYARDNIHTLRELLSTKVLEIFEEACADRRKRREILELTLIGIESAEIAHVRTTVEALEITVLFRSQIVKAERSASGDVIRGDPVAIQSTADRWTFARALPLKSNSWVIVETDGEQGELA